MNGNVGHGTIAVISVLERFFMSTPSNNNKDTPVAPKPFRERILGRGMSLLEFSGKLGLLLVIPILIVTIVSPAFSLALGNVFFGEIKPLYNIRIAQFFFSQATDPVFPGQSEPPHAHYQLSRVFFIQGKLYRALDEAEIELSHYPENSKTYYILGLTLGYLGRTSEAIDAFSKYIDTHPGTWAGRNDKAWLQFRAGDIDGALATIEPISESFPYTPWVQNTLCALLINKEDRLADAEKACSRAKESIDKMTARDWGRAYPGNHPQIYENGLESMQEAIENNLQLLAKRK